MIPMTSQEVGFRPVRSQYPDNSVRLLVSHTLLLAKRILTRWARDLVTVIEALVFPILFLLVLKIVLGNLIYAVTHDNPLYSIVPLIALGAAITWLHLRRDRPDARTLQRSAFPIMGAACAPGIGLALSNPRRRGSDSVHQRRDAECGDNIGLPVSAGCDRESYVA